MTETFDAIVVGAGPAGNAAAYTLAGRGLNVLQIERGEYPGSKNVQGAILYADALERIIPEFRDEAPLERHVIEQRMWMMDDTGHTSVHHRSDSFNEDKPNRYTIIRAQFDKWFSSKVREAGALLLCETTVTALVRDDSGKVIGVETDREGGAILADVVVLADGVNSLLAERAGFHPPVKPKDVALAVKEMHFLPRDVIDARFNVNGEEGVVIEALGTVTDGLMGTGFLYTNGESLAVGIGCMVADFEANPIPPYAMLERFKAHPSIRPLLAGSEVKEYAAHLIPEGGYNAVPRCHGAGWVLVGDAAMLVNAAHREGSNMAMTSGRLAAETIAEAREAGKPMTAKTLSAYRKALEESFVLKDLKKYRRMPEIFHDNKQFFTDYPRLVGNAARTMLRVDGIDKRTKTKEIGRSFRSSRSAMGLMGDAIKLMRAFR